MLVTHNPPSASSASPSGKVPGPYSATVLLVDRELAIRIAIVEPRCVRRAKVSLTQSVFPSSARDDFVGVAQTVGDHPRFAIVNPRDEALMTLLER